MSNQEINAQLLAALKDLFADYKELADSGDAGSWSLEDLPVGKQAMAAIAVAEQQQDYFSNCFSNTPPASEPDVYAPDAARYQWLLHQAWFQEACDRFDFEDGGLQNRFEKCVDEMIDRAMLAAVKGE